MSASTEKAGDGWLVTCREHALDRWVKTEQHAENLRALHDRLDHPDETPEDDTLTVDLRRAAITVMTSQDQANGWPFHYETGVVTLWEALTGLEGNAALELARQLADSLTPVTAHAAPF